MTEGMRIKEKSAASASRPAMLSIAAKARSNRLNFFAFLVRGRRAEGSACR
jgi:hypothetical protein